MTELNAFQPLNDGVQVLAEIRAIDEGFRLTFQLIDPNHVVKDSPRPGKSDTWPRGDGLWRTTCFECFLGVPAEPGYWEINFSPNSHEWALYRFNDYRKPDPPQNSEDFELIRVSVTEDSLTSDLRSKRNLKNLSINLTAVIKTAEDVSYFSLKHRPEKPDFHWREGFIYQLFR